MTERTYPRQINELVINWHLTQVCNFRCRYCYSHWKVHSQNNEVFRDTSATNQFLEELYRHFSLDNAENPLAAKLRWNGLRLNLAGGEPLVYPDRIAQIARKAKSLGFSVSLITNGSLLNIGTVSEIAGTVDLLGVSLDSADQQTNQGVGRINRSGELLSIARLEEAIKRAREINPALAIKINTVVNELNHNEDMTPLIKRMSPNKWKVLRVLPVVSSDLAISEEQFFAFVRRHRHFSDILIAEDNQNMIESYIMIDPFGRFFQNRSCLTTEDSYIYSEPIPLIGPETAFAQINFDVEKFACRYGSAPMRGAA